MEQIQAHVAQYKKDIVSNLVNLINQYSIIGVVNMENLPAPQLQVMRAQLRGSFFITMTKRRLMNLAIEQTKQKKKGIEHLEAHLGGMPALIFTKENPFKLSKTLQKSKSPAPAKAGQTAPRDIMVNKGQTSFAPGPIIGELAMAGIKSGVEGGKVAIKEDVIVVKAGEKIKPKVAEILTRLGVQPMEVGLDLVAVYENGLIYGRDVLSVNEDEYKNRLTNASRWAFNLAVYTSYPT
ncbi:MAG: 50S ribosomal protein L10, partial [Nanoarchaeota archaeon]